MDKIENLISITEVPAGPYIIKGEFKIITKDGKENILTGTNALCRLSLIHISEPTRPY